MVEVCGFRTGREVGQGVFFVDVWSVWLLVVCVVVSFGVDAVVLCVVMCRI